MTFPAAIAWAPGRRVRVLDQTLLPAEERYLDLASADDVAEAIRTLRVRGAPLIGIAAAMGMALEAAKAGAGEASDGLARARAAGRVLGATRPTAVNLQWAIARMLARAESAAAAGESVADALTAESETIAAEDRAMCERIGRLGAALLPDDATVCTICNAGALATGGMGTALAPVYVAHAAGRRPRVIVPETRPLLQGSRLTAWELGRAGVPCTIIADGMIASRLRRGDVSCVIVGADRIAANGDVANKIGTYGLALAARAHGVPFYVAAPTSTLDPATPDGSRIPIEERAADEILAWGGRRTGPAGAAVWNPAFDVTPAELITAIITDRGVHPPAAVTAAAQPLGAGA
ncbi:MAG TPA: S-methyl-5-thioribose-1-phosphate isomerase [Gemmatimonadales bacterium]